VHGIEKAQLKARCVEIRENELTASENMRRCETGQSNRLNLLFHFSSPVLLSSVQEYYRPICLRNHTNNPDCSAPLDSGYCGATERLVCARNAVQPPLSGRAVAAAAQPGAGRRPDGVTPRAADPRRRRRRLAPGGRQHRPLRLPGGRRARR
jgi:hypothetical protein